MKNHKVTFLFVINFILLAILKEAYVAIIFIALVFLGVRNTKKYLPLSILIFSLMLFLNPFFGGFPSPLWNLALIIFAYFLAIKKRLTFNKLEIAYGAILLSFLLTSLSSSYFPSIAIIKVISLSVFSFVLFKTYKYGIINELVLIQIIESIFIVNLALFFSSYGYYKNGLFMGIFNHSQSIGLFIVPFHIFYTVFYFENKTRGSWNKVFSLVMIILGLMEILASYSRTAIFTDIILLTFYFIFTREKVKNIISIVASPFKLIILTLVLVFISINVQKISSIAKNYIFKSYSNDLFESSGHENIFDSREGLFLESYNNFKHNPMVGNGFGVQYRDGQLSNNELKYLPLLDVPYTMVNEKGNVYIMVLEEGGLITFSLFIFFISLLLIKTKIYKPSIYPMISILIMFNGEATFFSLNGVGAFQFSFLILLYFLAKMKKGRTF